MAIDFEAFKAYLESDGEIEFDLWAQNPGDWTWLQEIIPGIIISSAGGIVPFQAEGLLEGLPFYYRDRHGSASLRVGTADCDFPYGDDVLYSSSVETPEYEGRENFIKNLVKLVKTLEKAPLLYKFEGKKLIFKNDKSWGYEISETEMDESYGWGHSPEEAWDYMLQPSAYLVEHGCSEDMQLQMNLDRAISRTPKNQDTRVYPEIPLVFRVNDTGNLPE